MKNKMWIICTIICLITINVLIPPVTSDISGYQKPASLTIDAGDDYTVDQTKKLHIDDAWALGGTPPYIYAWDLDEDGAYDDAAEYHPYWAWGLPDIITIGFKVTDSTGQTAYDTALVTINDIGTAPVNCPDLQLGDLVAMDCIGHGGKYHQDGSSNDHISIYVGNEVFIEAQPFVCEPKNDPYQWEGIWYIDWDGLNYYFENFTFWRVTTASADQKQNALDFCIDRLNDADAGYQAWYELSNRKWHDPDGAGPLANLWWCAELAWAAYYNCNGVIGSGIDIDTDGWFLWWILGVTVDDIKEDTDVNQIIT